MTTSKPTYDAIRRDGGRTFGLLDGVPYAEGQRFLVKDGQWICPIYAPVVESHGCEACAGPRQVGTSMCWRCYMHDVYGWTLAAPTSEARAPAPRAPLDPNDLTVFSLD